MLEAANIGRGCSGHWRGLSRHWILRLRLRSFRRSFCFTRNALLAPTGIVADICWTPLKERHFEFFLKINALIQGLVSAGVKMQPVSRFENVVKWAV
jgi:hypothetical protein